VKFPNFVERALPARILGEQDALRARSPSLSGLHKARCEKLINSTPSPPWGRGWPAPAFSSAEAGRVRGSQLFVHSLDVHSSPVNTLGRDHATSSTFLTNSSGASKTIPLGIRMIVYPNRLSLASRLASRLA